MPRWPSGPTSRTGPRYCPSLRLKAHSPRRGAGAASVSEGSTGTTSAREAAASGEAPRGTTAASRSTAGSGSGAHETSKSAAHRSSTRMSFSAGMSTAPPETSQDETHGSRGEHLRPPQCLPSGLTTQGSGVRGRRATLVRPSLPSSGETVILLELLSKRAGRESRCWMHD